ncbi:MAG: C-GCAxxG-C-C family protein [Eubacteriales bacterium]|nr:C-GCAxxG-C-C family protein [Eubacteriales bacterium]MDD4583309.1 C-GCAxxG-C-C family protein [Eubacteriales bacterium]
MDIFRIMELKFKGYCCSQMIMQMGLEGLGKENIDLVDAMAGLCDGMHRGKTCGTLSASFCLLYLADKRQADTMCDELHDWFEELFGNTECDILLEGNPLNKAVLCKEIVEGTYLKLVDMFESYDIEFRREK